jgi:hypothetical protein
MGLNYSFFTMQVFRQPTNRLRQIGRRLTRFSVHISRTRFDEQLLDRSAGCLRTVCGPTGWSDE